MKISQFVMFWWPAVTRIRRERLHISVKALPYSVQHEKQKVGFCFWSSILAELKRGSAITSVGYYLQTVSSRNRSINSEAIDKRSGVNVRQM